MSGEKLEFELVKYQEDWKGLESAWLKLFTQCNRSCPFYHPIFLNSADVLPLHEQPSHLVIGTSGGNLVFGLPVSVNRSALFINKLSMYAVRNSGFDHLMPLDSSPNWEASRELFKRFSKYTGANSFSVLNSDAEFADLLDSTFIKKRGFFRTRAFNCPYLNLPSTEDSLLDSLSKKFSSNLRRALSQAERCSITFRVILDNKENYSLINALENLKSLHQSRCESQNRDSKFLTLGSQLYHARLCKEADKYSNIIHCFEAIHQGQIIASLYGYLIGRRFYFYQSGFISEYSKYSIGSLLIYNAMAYLINRQVEVFDFLRGTEKYKFKWTKTSRSNYLILAGISPVGNAATKWIRLKRSMRRNGRREGTWLWLLGRD